MEVFESIKNCLIPIMTADKIHNEVCKDAMILYLKNYEIYNKGWEFSDNRLPQCMSVGGCLRRSNADKMSVSISADILTGKNVFKYRHTDKRIQELFEIFKNVYYSQGNMLPVTEGGNFGGVNCDSFTRTLNICKEAFMANNKNYVDFIAEKLESGRPIGRFHYESIHYWIKKEWLDLNKEWEDFVKENYLIDMVDETYSPYSFVVGRKNGEQTGIRKSDSVIVECQTLERTIKLIIQRSYRIENKKKGKLEAWEQNLLEDYYFNIGLSK